MYKFFSALLILTVAALAFLSCGDKRVSKPTMMTVEEWGGKAPTGTKEVQKIEYITIHHSGVVFEEDADPIQKIKGLQRFSQEDKGWIDIPYHFALDLDGNIYVERPIEYAGDTNTEYDPTGHALIEVMGNYEVQTIKPEQLDALAHLTAWLAQEYNVPVDHIASHKDHSDQTVCPGKDLYKYFESGEFIKKVEAYLNHEK